MLRLVVLISGTGSNLLSLLEACDGEGFPAEVVAVGADRNASGLSHAEGRGIPTFIVNWNDYADRESWGAALLEQIRVHTPGPGAHAVRDALAAGVERTGASIIVVDSGVDSGPVLAQERIRVLEGDTQDSLHDRIKTVERQLLVRTIREIANGDIILEEPA